MKKLIPLMIVLMALVGCQSMATDQPEASESTDLSDMKLSDDLKADAQKVFETIEKAHDAQRELNATETSLVQKFLSRYEDKGDNFKETLLISDIGRMKSNIIPPEDALPNDMNLYKQASTEAGKILNGTLKHVTPLE